MSGGAACSERPAVRREIAGEGRVRLFSDACVFTYERLRPGALLVTIEGNDTGQFGRETLDEIAREWTHCEAPTLVFVDARRATGPSTVVMEAWTAWLAANRARLGRLVVLIPEGSKLLHLTVSIAQHLSRTGNLIRICSDEGEFERLAGECAAEGRELRKGP